VEWPFFKKSGKNKKYTCMRYALILIDMNIENNKHLSANNKIL
jgi:hypothetical protein